MPRFRTVWHAQSTLLLDAPRCFATPALLRMLLAPGRARLIYAGDRMWPALAFGAELDAFPLDPDDVVATGDVVVVATDGIPELLRVDAIDADAVRLVADADPRLELTASRSDLLARTELPRRASTRERRGWRRVALDVLEATRHGPDAPAGADAAATVRDKYEMQAPFYSRVAGDPIEPRLRRWAARRIETGGRVLVVGSGAGKEAIELARMGYRVRGVDFAPAMVELARAAATEAGVDVRFDAADLRTLRLAPGALDGVFFTYDVYSFLPSAAGRVAALCALRTWLRPGGALLLSARRVSGAWVRAVLGWQWLCRIARGEAAAPGDTHTRYVTLDGRLHRSYVHVFGDRGLRAEIADGGFVVRGELENHLELRAVDRRPTGEAPRAERTQ